MHYNNEDILTVTSFLKQFLQEKSQEELIEICRKCITKVEKYIMVQDVDIQLFLTSVFRACSISFYQMDGMKNRSNYIAFKENIKENPVLMMVKNRTLKKLINKKSFNEECDRLVWIKMKNNKYNLHIGSEVKTINSRELFWIYCCERKNLSSQYYIGALIQSPSIR